MEMIRHNRAIACSNYSISSLVLNLTVFTASHILLGKFDTQIVCILQMGWRCNIILTKNWLTTSSSWREGPRCKRCKITDGQEWVAAYVFKLKIILKISSLSVLIWYHLDLVCRLVFDWCTLNNNRCTRADVPDSEHVVVFDTEGDQIFRIRREGHWLDTFLMERQPAL